MKHKHYETILAWAEGKKIQFKAFDGDWMDCIQTPNWNEGNEYRVKPEPKPDVVLTGRIWSTDIGRIALAGFSAHPNVRFTFDGDTCECKAVELIK